MSVYDQQLAALQSQYQQYMAKVPQTGLSAATITDLQKALKAQQQIQALTNQYAAAQQANLSDLQSQQKSDISGSKTNTQTALTLFSNAANAYNAGLGKVEGMPGSGLPIWADPYSQPTKATASNVSQLVAGASAPGMQSEITKDWSPATWNWVNTSLIQPVQQAQKDVGTAEAQQLGALKLTPTIQNLSSAYNTTLSSLPSEQAAISQTQSKLASDKNLLRIQQAQQSAQTGQAPSPQGTTSTGAVQSAAAPKAPKAAAAFNALTPTGMAPDTQQAVGRANRTGEPTSPFVLPSLSGLTFGGN
jgi:hypothetical protein